MVMCCFFLFVHTEALQTYRKTLARFPKESEHDRRLRRSRQRKVTLCISSTYVHCRVFWLQKYERRGRHVKPEEMSQTDPSMMSDEEDIDGQFKVHRQEWHSEDFMEELDDRASAGNSKLCPQVSRYYGTPRKTKSPTSVPQWMVSNTNIDDEVLAPNSPN